MKTMKPTGIEIRVPKKSLPEGEIGGDETIFGLNEGAKAQHSWPM